MKKPDKPDNEKKRLDVLCALDLLDTPAEERFDRLTRIALRHFEVSIALVSLVDTKRQWFKSRQGLDASETSRDISFCGHAILADDIFYIPETLDDPRFADNPLVTGAPFIRFYAGAPLHARSGERVGTLCMIDNKPRHFSAEQLTVLRDLADGVEAELDRTRLLEASSEASRLAMVAEHTDNAVIITDANGLTEWVNKGFERISGYLLEEVLGKKPGEVLQGRDTDPATVALISEQIRGGEAFSAEILNYHKNGTPYWLSLYIQSVLDEAGSSHFIAIESDITERKQSEHRMLTQNHLLDAISSVQSRFIQHEDTRQSFDEMLTDLLGLSASEYGFIGEVKYNEKGGPYLKTYALTNIAWNDDMQRFYDENAPGGMEFTNLETLFGAVMKTGKPVIANDPANDPRSGGLPKGHPALKAFLGLPVYQGSRMIGMVGLANRSEGYDQELVEYLAPFIGTIGTLIEAMQNEQRRKLVSDELGRFKHILDKTQDMVFMFDGETLQFNYLNDAAIKSMGYSEEELHQMYLYDIKPELPEKKFKKLIEPLISGQTTVMNYETIHRRKDGSDFPVATTLQLIQEDDGSSGFVAIVRDITERKAHENRLLDAEHRMRAVIETVVDGIVTIDSRGMVCSFNPAAEDIFGYSANEVIGRNVNLLMPNPYRTEHDTYLSNYLTSGERKIIGIGREVTGLRKDGATFPMELAVSEMEVSGERMFTGIVRDITERKRLDRMKSEFISTVSHELRTPLTSIRGALSLVLSKAAKELSGKPLRMLEVAERNSERLTLLINDILDLEKIESGRMEFEFGEVNLVSVARQAVLDNEGYAQKHHVRLALGYMPEQAIIYGDDNRLLQVFANLISNAVKYSPENGIVEISVLPRGHSFRVEVRDHGSGIPEAFRNQIFQRFAQADSSNTREKGGTGLGLSITKAIVERHEGQIDFESEPGKGTAFYFDLQASKKTGSEGKAVTSGIHVLICEDKTDVAMILSEMLSSAGISSDTASTAEAARSMLGKNNYRLLLLDLTLPDIDGLQFLQELRADPDTVELPVIVVSGRAEEGRIAFKGDAMTVVDWLQKPIDQGRLERALHDALNRGARPHILHVEDDPDIVQISQVLLEDMADLSHVPSLKAARQRLAKDKYDLVILDLGLADGSGIELLDELKGRCPVVIFSAQNPDRDITKQVQAALTKSTTSNEQLLTTIKNVLNGSL